jgi:hypothetical protein
VLNEEKKTRYSIFYNDLLNKLTSHSKRLVGDHGKIGKVFFYFDKYSGLMLNNMLKSDQIDAHKTASAFFCAYLKAKPISYVPDGSGKPKIIAEEAVDVYGAFLFGLQITQDSWADKAASCASPTDKEIYQNIICLPETSEDTYAHWFIKLFDEKIKEYFDYEKEVFIEKAMFYISHIYFLIESYAYQYYKNKLNEDRLQELERRLRD